MNLVSNKIYSLYNELFKEYAEYLPLHVEYEYNVYGGTLKLSMCYANSDNASIDYNSGFSELLGFSVKSIEGFCACGVIHFYKVAGFGYNKDSHICYKINSNKRININKEKKTQIRKCFLLFTELISMHYMKYSKIMITSKVNDAVFEIADDYKEGEKFVNQKSNADVIIKTKNIIDENLIKKSITENLNKINLIKNSIILETASIIRP